MLKMDAVSPISLSASNYSKLFSRASHVNIIEDAKKDEQEKQRSGHALKVSGLLLFPTLLLVCISAIAQQDALGVQSNAHNVINSIRVTLEVAELVRMLQLERGRSSMFLSSNNSRTDIHAVLTRNRRNTDESLKDVSDWSFIDIPQLQNSPPSLRRENLLIFLGRFRRQIDIRAISVVDSLTFYTDLNVNLINTFFAKVELVDEYEQQVAFENFIRGADLAGLQRGIAASFWLPCDYGGNKVWFIETHSNHAVMMSLAFSLMEDLQRKYARELAAHGQLWERVENMVHYIISSSFRENCTTKSMSERMTMAEDWFGNMTIYINMLSDVNQHLMDTLFSTFQASFHNSQSKVILISCILVGVVTCAMGTVYNMFSVFKIIAKLRHYSLSITKKTKRIEEERRFLDDLLAMMLPKSVSEALQKDGHVDPEYFEDVTVFFSDIPGFTQITARSSPHQIIEVLNMLYTHFDAIIDEYDVYKVETISDSYMVASGLPERNGDRHVAEVAHMSLDLIKHVAGLNVPHCPEQSVTLRVGIHSGPCVAGIVGLKKPRYCLFGDTINTASRMETTGQAMMIHISHVVYAKLLSQGGFNMDCRGEVFVKGKGEMETYWLIGHENQR